MRDHSEEARAISACEGLARCAAQNLQSDQASVDVLAFDQDDYRSRFFERAWVTRSRPVVSADEDGAETASSRYVSAAVWNLARQLKRERARRYGKAGRYIDRDPELVSNHMDLDRQTEIREMLAKIRARLPPKYWEIIEQYAEAGCKPAVAWDPESGVKFRTWKTGLHRARARARAVSKKIE